jgi:hypothetical protein
MRLPIRKLMRLMKNLGKRRSINPVNPFPIHLQKNSMEEKQVIVPDEVKGPTSEPQKPPTPKNKPSLEEPPAPEGAIVFDTHRDTKLHDRVVRTVDKEGKISPNGLGIECRASGEPTINVNNDGTFSLVCREGHGRIYPYDINYNSQLLIRFAFWKTAPGQDISLKLRSRHNEGGKPEERFGGYGFSIDQGSKKWVAKREIYHNKHDQRESGNLPKAISVQEYVTIKYTVADDNGEVSQIVEIDYGDGNGFKKVMEKTDDAPKPYMVYKPLYEKQSYFWVRQNIDSGIGELRIKDMKITSLG